MATISNSAKGLQQNRLRPAVPRPIIPAIPLPYIQKRQKQQAERARALEEAIAPATVKEISTPTLTPVIPTLAVNGLSDEKASEKTEESVAPTSPGTSITPATSGGEEAHEEITERSEVMADETTLGK